MRKRLSFILLALCIGTSAAAAPPPATSVSSASRALAKRHFQQGIALFNEGNYDAALAEFEAAFRDYPVAAFLYNIGLTQKALFRYEDAITTLSGYLEQAKGEPKERVAEVRRVIAEMRALLAPVTLSISPTGAAVSVDGRFLGAITALSLAAGTHVVEVTADGYEAMKRRVIVAAGVPVALAFQLKVIPRSGIVRIRSMQPQSTIRIDGKFAGVGAVETNLSGGGHSLEVIASGYKTHRSELVVTPGQRREVDVTMERAEAGGAVHKKWWFWTGIGVLVVGGIATAVAIPLSSKPEDPLVGTLSPGAGKVN